MISRIIIASLLVFLSCKEDDEQVNPKISPLVGTWSLTQTVYSNCSESSMNGTYTNNCSTDVSECIKLTFTKDNKITVHGGSTYVNGTYSTNGNKLTITFYGVNTILTFNISGNTLGLNYDDEDCDIKEVYIKS